MDEPVGVSLIHSQWLLQSISQHYSYVFQDPNSAP